MLKIFGIITVATLLCVACTATVPTATPTLAPTLTLAPTREPTLYPGWMPSNEAVAEALEAISQVEDISDRVVGHICMIARGGNPALGLEDLTDDRRIFKAVTRYCSLLPGFPPNISTLTPRGP